MSQFVGLGIALGAGIGTVVGVLTDNLALGVALGAGLGVVVGASLSSLRR